METAGALLEVTALVVLYLGPSRWKWERNVTAAALAAAGWWLLGLWLMTYIMAGLLAYGVYLWCSDEEAHRGQG